MSTRTYFAKWIFPASAPPIENAIIACRGETIVAVEPWSNRRKYQDVEDLGHVAIIPGLVNAHTHLDLSGARGLIPPTNAAEFAGWLRAVINYRRSRTRTQTQADIRAGLTECLRFGTTLIGDIASDGQSWDVLVQASVRSHVFYELIGLTELRAIQAKQTALKWYDDLQRPDTLLTRKCISPHSPYSANRLLFRDFEKVQYTLAVHYMESNAEVELLQHHTGSMREFLEDVGAWEENSTRDRIEDYILFNRSAHRTVFAHCNYMPTNFARFFTSTQSIVYCPRTHAAFEHPPHPFREFMKRRCRVCLGTDSLASNPDLDIFAEAQLIHRLYPDFSSTELLRMITMYGAEALGRSDVAGSLERGKSADFVVMPLPNEACDDPYEWLWRSVGPRRTMFRGKWRE